VFALGQMLPMDDEENNKVKASSNVRKCSDKVKYDLWWYVVSHKLPNAVKCHGPPLNEKCHYKERHGFSSAVRSSHTCWHWSGRFLHLCTVFSNLEPGKKVENRVHDENQQQRDGSEECIRDLSFDTIEITAAIKSDQICTCIFLDLMCTAVKSIMVITSTL